MVEREFPSDWIAIDLDGVLLEFPNARDAWNKPIFGEAREGAVELVDGVRALGYKVLVFTARDKCIFKDLNTHLFREGIKVDAIEHKTSAIMYIDDRGWRVESELCPEVPKILDKLKSFQVEKSTS